MSKRAFEQFHVYKLFFETNPNRWKKSKSKRIECVTEKQDQSVKQNKKCWQNNVTRICYLCTTFSFKNGLLGKLVACILKSQKYGICICAVWKTEAKRLHKRESSKTSLAEYKYTLNSIVDAVNEWAEERAREREWESER